MGEFTKTFDTNKLILQPAPKDCLPRSQIFIFSPSSPLLFFPMTLPNSETLQAIQALIDVVAKLRNPEGGCPWDLAQTRESLTPYIIEEAYETVDAIATGNTQHIAEELGDLLLQVILQAQIAQESKQFTLQQIAQGITDKLIRRHPHVFGEQDVTSVDEVRQNWEAIKAAEKGETVEQQQQLSRKLSEYARKLPPLMATTKISEKAAKIGFEWENIDGVWDKFHEELDEFRHAIEHESPERQQEELGDLLFSLSQLARWKNIDTSAALRGTNHRFIQRFMQMEEFADRPLSNYTLAELEELWQKAKANLANQK